LVARHGKIVAEASYAPYAAGILHQVNSVTKAVTSTLTAIASEDGLLDSPRPALSCSVAAIISIVESCSRLNISIRDYLGSVQPGLANRPISQIAQFTLAAWANRNASARPPTSAAV
jgi:Beta-lactamase